MAKSKDAGVAPVSKYATKKQTPKATTKVDKEEVSQPDVKATDVISKSSEQDSTKETPKANIAKEVAHVSAPTNHIDLRKKNNNKKKSSVPEVAGNYPEHFVNLAMIIKNNAEIRRFTSIGILNYLLQKKEIRGNNRFVSFKWNKFSVKCDGLTREYSYTETFFLNCLVAAFTSFSASAQKTIDTFTSKELDLNIQDALSTEEVDNIANLNEEYVTVNS